MIEKEANQYLSESDWLPNGLFLSMKINCYFIDEATFDKKANWYLVDKASFDRDLISESDLLICGTLYFTSYLGFANK